MCKTFGLAPDVFPDMEWNTFRSWLETKQRLEQGPELSPDSWAGYQNDPWYVEQKRKQAEERARR